MNHLPTCWIIDHSREAAASLRQLLETQGYGQVLGISAAVADWPGVAVDCLFIRISAWDDYLWWRHAEHRHAAETIVFLSGRFEKCTQHLVEDIDFYLRPPYRASRLAGIMRRRTDPDFHRRPLDFFFLKADYRFEVIYFTQLLYVRGNGGGTIQVRTSNHEYTLSGTLAAFERRLPVPWQRVNRSLLVAQYEPGPLEKTGRSFG
jgi:DNA-binding LytR/AlgR family response regulator